MAKNYKHKGGIAEIEEAIDWAKKVEQDSRTRVENGEFKYTRAVSNAIMRAAMLFGRLSKLYYYANKNVKESALIFIADYFQMRIILVLQKTSVPGTNGR